MEFKIDFQDLEKVLKSAKICIRCLKSMKILKYLLLKAKHFIIYAVLCNVQNSIS